MSDLKEQVAGRPWYHTMDLPGGVTTQGIFDLRRIPAKLPFPSLAGKRCLDIGTCDGFWAFELERRGATEVVAIDLADPTKRDTSVGVTRDLGTTTRSISNFALVHEALGSQVQWRDLSVYDLSPQEVGTFDFVFMGSLLLHLRDPIQALIAVRSVVGGEFLSYDAIAPMLTVLAPRTPAAQLHGTRRNDWWFPNKAGRVRELESAGFTVKRSGRVSWVPMRQRSLRPKHFRHRPFSTALLYAKGVPHTWVLATPGS
jgi:tRNA (mo5U34)-methyltransferase